MNNTEVKELNALLKGERMAINGYEKYIQSIDDKSIKDELQKIQQDHKQHAIKIAEKIQNLGGQPENGVGFTGKVAEVMSNLKDIGMGLKDTHAILKDAYSGESNGIKMGDEVVKGDLGPESRELVSDILNDDRNHVQRLGQLINNPQGLQ